MINIQWFEELFKTRKSSDPDLSFSTTHSENKSRKVSCKSIIQKRVKSMMEDSFELRRRKSLRDLLFLARKHGFDTEIIQMCNGGSLLSCAKIPKGPLRMCSLCKLQLKYASTKIYKCSECHEMVCLNCIDLKPNDLKSKSKIPVVCLEC